MGSKTAYKSFYENLKTVECKNCNSHFLRENPNSKFCSDRCRFLDKVDIESNSPCFVWTGNKHSKGYGTIKILGKNLKAHRYSYQLFCGKIPEGMMVLHSCDNPPCVNPDHLRLGNVQDNADDMTLRNRQAKKKNGMWKLSDNK